MARSFVNRDSFVAHASVPCLHIHVDISSEPRPSGSGTLNSLAGAPTCHNTFRSRSRLIAVMMGRIMKAAVLAVSLAVLALRGLSAQPPPDPPAFEVASIKPTSPQQRILAIYTYPGGRITVTMYTLRQLLEEAFNVQSFQISGDPRWINEDRYDIDARPPASSKSSKANPNNPKLPPNDEQRRMLQTLLIDRFQLKYHRETKDGPVYLLLRGKKELKLKPAKNKDDYPWAGSAAGGAPFAYGIAGTNISMAQLATRLTRPLGHPVLDQTGIDGSFDFKVEYASDDPDADVISSILSSIQALGLKLESSKGPVETIVIDHAEKPSAN
jgi:uncharacterized protein (TIGR03435 family)